MYSGINTHLYLNGILLFENYNVEKNKLNRIWSLTVINPIINLI